MPLHTVQSRIGDAEVFQIVELEIGHELVGVLPGATPEFMKSIPWMKPPYVHDDYSIRAHSQCFIVRKGERILVVDTCVGNDKDLPGFPDWDNMQLDFLDTLQGLGIDRNAVTDVLCTHLHFDHVGWNTHKKDGMWFPTFPNAKYYVGRTEYDYWLEANPADPMYQKQEISFNESVKPIVDAGLMTFIEPDTDLGDGFNVFGTPGHTPGHIAIEIDAGSERFIIAGDAMHHPVQIAEPDMATVVDHDSAQSSATRHKLLSRLNGSQTLFTCTHFCAPSFGRISQDQEDRYVFSGVDKAK